MSGQATEGMKKMTITELTAELRRLTDMMAAKGYPRPEVVALIRSNNHTGLLVQYRGAEGKWPTNIGTAYHADGDDLAAKLAYAEAWIIAAPKFNVAAMNEVQK